MRTTINLPEDLYELARQLAHDANRSMSDVIAELIRLGLRPSPARPTTTRRGMPQVSLGRPIVAEDVRALEDET